MFYFLGVCDQDIDIYGLGWLSFTNTKPFSGECKIIIYLPEGIKFEMRDSIYRFDRTHFYNKTKIR
jgi:hypothetical protein